MENYIELEENDYDLEDFEDYLEREFFVGNDFFEIEELIDLRISKDVDFIEKYELWLEEYGYDSWEEYYEVCRDRIETGLDTFYPNRHDDDYDDDVEIDFLTKE